MVNALADSNLEYIPIALLRHGHTDWNMQGRIQGRVDRPLLPEAAAALKALCLPAPWDQADLLASPLSRAIETAQCVAKRQPKLDSALVEMDWGDWEGQQGKTLLEDSKSGYRDLSAWGWNFQPPNGESVAVVARRAQQALHKIQNRTVIVTHINVMRVILAKAHGWDFQGDPPFQVKRNRLYPLYLQAGIPVKAEAPIRLPAMA